MLSQRSVSLRSNGSCPSGFHKRKSYTSRSGHRVSARCVRATTPYKESSAEFKRRVSRRSTRRLGRYIGTLKSCPPGKILRAPYVRRFATAIRQKGYTRKTKTGKVIHVNPTKKSAILVPGACIENKGKKGKGTQRIGPLRKGELAKYGYSASKPESQRHAALRRAIGRLGSNNVYHKLDAVAKLAVRTAPDKSKIFAADRDWVRRQFGISAF
jgi:hypothetical protein